jgi:predicted RNase H-like HicB family nuclease
MPKAKYEVIIYWSDDYQASIAEALELSGCAADGKAHRDALRNVEAIILEWLETSRDFGRPIPKPKGRVAFAPRY